jgi:hypothetical protein
MEGAFEAVDFPQTNRLTIHILAAVAEHEAKGPVPSSRQAGKGRPGAGGRLTWRLSSASYRRPGKRACGPLQTNSTNVAFRQRDAVAGKRARLANCCRGLGGERRRLSVTRFHKRLVIGGRRNLNSAPQPPTPSRTSLPW